MTKPKCEDCKYIQIDDFEFNGKKYRNAYCTLTSVVVNYCKPSSCEYFNADLSDQDICYNCENYIGGRDWGLFCRHDKKHYYIGKFNDEPCEYYNRRQDAEKLSKM